MRPILAPLAAIALLNACAASSPAPVSAGVSTPRAPAARLDAETALSRAGAPNAISTAQARALLGAPDVERRDGVGALMVWTTRGCALALGFANDRLATVEPGPRRTGEPAPSLAQCLGELRDRAATS